jgi:soluble lytic murein transglycosylase-like protein
MGNLIAERLLHPNTVSPYDDLQAWLAKYSDQAPARDIYKLANMRRPRGQSHKSPEVGGKSMGKYGDPDARFKNRNDRDEPSVASKKTRSRMLRRLKFYRVRGNYDKAIALLNKSTTRDILGGETYAQVSIKLARTLLNNGEFRMAESVSDKAVRDSSSAQPEGLWISGFAAYRQNHYDEAAGTFRRLVYTVPPQSQYYARAAWWASRAYEQLDRGSMSRVFLTMASHDRYSFYGQLALNRMEKQPDFSWVVPRIKTEDRKRLLADPAIRRVIALSQIGEHGLAQEELKAAYERIPYDMDESLLALSIELDLPATSMTLARNLKERNKEYIAGLYPHSRTWQPFGGFKVDQALMFAIMRQESAFNPAISSRVGAMGLMQVMPGTADQVRQMQGKRPVLKTALTRPDFNMSISQDYLIYLQEQMSDNLVHMIASYNAGPGNVRKWIARDGVEDDPILFIESIPFEETRKYVIRVMSNLWVYRTYFYGKTPTLTAMSNNRWPTQVAMVKLRDIDG